MNPAQIVRGFCKENDGYSVSGHDIPQSLQTPINEFLTELATAMSQHDTVIASDLICSSFDNLQVGFTATGFYLGHSAWDSNTILCFATSNIEAIKTLDIKPETYQSLGTTFEKLLNMITNNESYEESYEVTYDGLTALWRKITRRPLKESKVQTKQFHLVDPLFPNKRDEMIAGFREAIAMLTS